MIFEVFVFNNDSYCILVIGNGLVRYIVRGLFDDTCRQMTESHEKCLYRFLDDTFASV